MYAQVAQFGFVGLDDRSYVAENPHVLAGLTESSVGWAWTTTTETHWAPLTWMSFMLDAQLGGPGPRLFHLTNLLLHLLNTLLVFYVLTRITRQAWRSALVAALFAIHPLHVESVAWVTERKDVLSGLFWFLALWAYVRYTEKPGSLRYAAVALAYVLGLLSKSMVVTLPLVLLILDGWPLRRIARRANEAAGSVAARAPATARAPAPEGAFPLRRLVLEKIPLALLAIPVSWIAWRGQASSGTLGSLDQFPMAMRAANVVVSSADYLRQTLWPAGLAVPYPYLPESLTTMRVAAAVAVFAALSGAALLTARTRPWLTTGWLWYLVTLLPVSGLVQAGAQARADRYTYLPLIGIFIMVVWEASERLAPLFVRRPRARVAAAACAIVVVAALCAAARGQVAYWRTSESLFTRALSVTDHNAVAHNGIGLDLFEKGQPENALAHYREALHDWPSYAEARVNAAAALVSLGRNHEAVEDYEAALRLRPRDPRILAHLGAALLNEGSTQAAVERLTEASRLDEEDPFVQERLGAALARAGRPEEALVPLRAAVRMHPADAQAQVNLGIDLAALGRLEEAQEAFGHALRLAPGSVVAHRSLGVVLARLGRLPDAVEHLEEAARLDPSDEGTRRNLERARAMLAR